MKKFIKDWWPLLLVAAWWLWKKTKKSNQSVVGSVTDPSLSVAEKRLSNAGFHKLGTKCPVCGSEMYGRVTANPDDSVLGTASANLIQTCSNPQCEMFHAEYLPLY